MNAADPTCDPESAALEVRVFHCTRGDAHKFWSIQVRGAVHTVRFGRIGRTGQTCQKHFATPEEADRAARRLIAEKLRKGYVGVSPEQAAQARPRRRAPKRVWRQLLLPFENLENAESAGPRAGRGGDDHHGNI